MARCCLGDACDFRVSRGLALACDGTAPAHLTHCKDAVTHANRMSTASLVERQTRLVAQARTFIPAWETAFACTILFLSTNAVVPLVFNPQLGGTGRTVSIRDPLSQPAWLLASLFIILMLFRFGG